MTDGWMVEVMIGNEDCPFRVYFKMARPRRYGCTDLDYRDCTYENCPHRLPAEELNND